MCSQNQPEWWQSIFIGASGGLAIWVADILREGYLRLRDEKRILKFLKDKNTISKEWAYASTQRIASFVNLTEDRVRFICYTSKKIDKVERPDECWSAR